MKTLTVNQMQTISGGKINWRSVGCSVGIGLVFGIAALGGGVAVGLVAIAVTSGGSFLCSAFYD